MSDFELAIPTILRHEGGFINNPNDPGGATDYGISLAFLKAIKATNHGFLPGHLDHPGDATIEDIKNLTKEDAVMLYRSQWWDRYQFDRINDQKVATKTFDMSVNMGTGRGALIIQEAVNTQKRKAVILEDGKLGSSSFTAINDCDPVFLYPIIERLMAAFYQSLYNSNPEQCGEFLKGWLNRAFDRD